MEGLKKILNFTDWSKKKYIIMTTLVFGFLGVIGILDNLGFGLEETILFPILKIKYIFLALTALSFYWMWEGFV